MGWGDAPGASSTELIHALAQFDPVGLAQALGRDEDHTNWFASVCDALLPDYAYSLGADQKGLALPNHLPVISVRQRLAAYAGPDLPWPPGWKRLWGAGALSLTHAHDPRTVVRHDVIPTSIRLPFDF